MKITGLCEKCVKCERWLGEPVCREEFEQAFTCDMAGQLVHFYELEEYPDEIEIAACESYRKKPSKEEIDSMLRGIFIEEAK